MAKELHKIIINNKRSYGDLNGVAIYLTDDLYKSLEKQKARDGTPVLKLLENGRALQGLKHLITIIKDYNKQSRIIFNSDKTKKVKSDYQGVRTEKS